MYSIQFEHDVFLFSTIFNFKEGEAGDGYMQPDDTDDFKIISTHMISYETEGDGQVVLPQPADVTYIINEDVKKARDEAIEKEIECHILQP
tara:strand:- start:382 stop:654 length:273 start_codon:yes stop_codon:yes gene_type:complete